MIKNQVTDGKVLLITFRLNINNEKEEHRGEVTMVRSEPGGP